MKPVWLLRLLILFLALSAAPIAHAAPIEIEVALQAGGEGQEVFQHIARLFEAERPDIKVNLYCDPRIADLLRVRILEKNFPEITSGDFGWWNLIHHGDMQELNAALEQPDWDHAYPSWRASFLPGTLDTYNDKGNNYVIPLSYYVQSIWFNKQMFREHHWSTPKTWDELLTLCQTIKSTGMSPFAFQGRYPFYAQALLDGAYYQQAGLTAFVAQKRLTPGSFENPAMLQSLSYLQQLSQQYFQPGAMGMDHTEAQLQFFLGHTAMIACGSWLRSEMAGKIPAGFELGTFNLPAINGGQGDPTALQAGSGYYTIFSHSKHPKEAIEFMRFMTSRKIATYFCQACDIPVAIRGVNEVGLSADLSDLARMIAATHTTYGEMAVGEHPKMAQVYEDVLHGILTGKITPPQGASALEQAARQCLYEDEHPDQIDVRHPIKTALLLLLFIAGIVYAICKSRFRRSSKSTLAVGPPPRRLSMSHALLFVGPSLLLFGLFVLLPAFKGFAWCLQQWDGLTDARYVGLRHFKQLLLTDDRFWIALGNNIYIMFVIPLFMVPLSLFLAAAVSRGVRGSRLFRASFLLPSVMGGVAGTLLWLHLYDPQAGVINAAIVGIGNGLHYVGLSSLGHWFESFNAFAWLSQDHLYTALLPMSVWGGFGFNFVLYLAAMEGIPAELYEASELDGATPWQQFRIVTLPLIWEVLTISTVFMIIGGMKAFESIWLLTNQQPSTSTHVIGTRMVQAMLTEMNVGEATAIAVLLFIMVFIATAVALTAMRRETIEM